MEQWNTGIVEYLGYKPNKLNELNKPNKLNELNKPK